MKNDMKLTVDTKRREFMRDSISASVSVAVAASVPTSALAVEDELSVDKEQQGYHLTSHILEYYKSAVS